MGLPTQTNTWFELIYLFILQNFNLLYSVKGKRSGYIYTKTAAYPESTARAASTINVSTSEHAKLSGYAIVFVAMSQTLPFTLYDTISGNTNTTFVYNTTLDNNAILSLVVSHPITQFVTSEEQN
jgi:hypothetical protein